jgi:hypothetical protein
MRLDPGGLVGLAAAKELLLKPAAERTVSNMPRMYVCEHQLELMLAAVKAYKPAKDEELDYQLLLEFLEERSSESAIWDEINPADIPF